MKPNLLRNREPSTVGSNAAWSADHASNQRDPAGSVKSLLISGTYFPPQTGGISHFMARLASALGPDRVCCLTGATARSGNYISVSETRVYRRPAIFKGTKCRRALAWGTTMAHILVRERPQVVQLGIAEEGSFGLWLHRWLGLPFIVYAYGNDILSAIQSPWETPRLALRRAERVLAISHFTADLVRRAGVAPERIEIVHPGCEVHRFRPCPARNDLRQALLGERSRDRVILTVANLVARKGHDMVIRALLRVHHRIPDVTYLIVGDGPYRPQLEALASSVGLRDRVLFAGPIPERDLVDIYALCDVFVMPSRDQSDTCDVEGFGMVFIEANACGKPVVAGRSGGIPDAVIDGVTGFLVTPEDSEHIGDALIRLLCDRELAGRLGEQGRARAVREFDWPHVAARVQAILASIVRDRTFHGPSSLPVANRA